MRTRFIQSGHGPERRRIEHSPTHAHAAPLAALSRGTRGPPQTSPARGTGARRTAARGRRGRARGGGELEGRLRRLRRRRPEQDARRSGNAHLPRRALPHGRGRAGNRERHPLECSRARGGLRRTDGHARRGDEHRLQPPAHRAPARDPQRARARGRWRAVRAGAARRRHPPAGANSGALCALDPGRPRLRAAFGAPRRHAGRDARRRAADHEQPADGAGLAPRAGHHDGRRGDVCDARDQRHRVSKRPPCRSTCWRPSPPLRAPARRSR